MGDEERGMPAEGRKGDSVEGGFSILLGEESIRAFMSSGDFSSARELERFMGLASRIEGRLTEEGSRSILAMAAGDNRLSRDFAVLQIAHILAKHGRDVLLVDCDFLAPGLSGIVENSEDNGFLDLLLYGSSLKTVAKTTGIDGVKVIGPGSFPVSRTIPFAQREFTKVREFLSRNHDVIIYCSTLYTDDGTVNPLASLADSLFLSCRLEEMPEGELRKNLGDLGPDHPPVDLICFGEDGEAASAGIAGEGGRDEEEGEKPAFHPPVKYKEDTRDDERSGRKEEPEETEAAAIEKTADLESEVGRKRGGMDLPRIITAAVVVVVAVFLVWWFIMHRSNSEKENEIKTAELVQKQRDAREKQERAQEETAGAGDSEAAGDKARGAGDDPGPEMEDGSKGKTGDRPGDKPGDRPAAGDAGGTGQKEVKAEEPPDGAGQGEALEVSEPATVTPAPEGSYYTVHVASFRDIGRAGRETDYLEKNGYVATVIETTVKGETWFRVYVGEFETREEAAALRLRLLDLSRVGYARVVTLKESDR